MLNIFFPLSITLAIETFMYMFLNWRSVLLFIVVSVLNIVLNPLMNFILGYSKDDTIYYSVLIAYEIGTTLVESLVIYIFIRIKYWKILVAAIIANGLSFLAGYLLEPVFYTKILIIVLTAIFLFVYFFLEFLTLFIVSRNKPNSDASNDASARDDNQ